MTAQDLKNSILQLAVEGKLLSRKEVAEALETTEGPKTGAELLEQIKAEKARLIAEGKIKKNTTKAGASGRALAEITEDEKPFDIPENWCWCRLGEILLKLTDGTHSTPKYTEKGIPFLSVKDMSSGKLDFSNCKYISVEEHKELYKRCNSEFGDLLLTKVGTTGIPVIVDTEEEFSLFVSVALLKFNQELIDNKYLKYLIESPLVQEQAKENTKGVGNKNWVMNDIANTIIVLPPLAEQKRIVAKIEELLPYIQKYDVAHTKLEEFNKKFPVEMQKSILQQAIMGKLTEDWRNEQASLAKTNSAGQLADRSSAKDLLKKIKAQKARLIAEGKIKKDTTKAGASGRALAEITEDEIPFDIPENWEFCRLGDIVNLYTGNSINETEKAKNYTGLKDGFNYIATKDVGFDKTINYNNGVKIPFDKENFRVAHKGFPLMCIEGGSAGRKIGILEEDVCFGNKLCVFESYLMDYSKFIYYYLQSPMFTDIFNSNMNGIIGGVSINKLKTLIIPLPPLAEQKVIVAKIEELLPLCKKLVK